MQKLADISLFESLGGTGSISSMSVFNDDEQNDDADDVYDGPVPFDDGIEDDVRGPDRYGSFGNLMDENEIFDWAYTSFLNISREAKTALDATVACKKDFDAGKLNKETVKKMLYAGKLVQRWCRKLPPIMFSSHMFLLDDDED